MENNKLQRAADNIRILAASMVEKAIKVFLIDNINLVLNCVPTTTSIISFNNIFIHI